MKQYKKTKQECIDILNKSNLPGTLTGKQIFTVLWWEYFNRKKMGLFYDNLFYGMGSKLAFENAQKKIEIKN